MGGIYDLLAETLDEQLFLGKEEGGTSKKLAISDELKMPLVWIDCEVYI